jgi:hypothetical protein
MKKETLAKYSKDPGILETLSKDEYWDVRRGAAYNPNTPIPTLETLSRDEYWYVRFEVAENPNASIPILESLSRDRDCDVQTAANQSLKDQG